MCTIFSNSGLRQYGHSCKPAYIWAALSPQAHWCPHGTIKVHLGVDEADAILSRHSRHSYVYPFRYRTAADRALLHLSRTVTASALVPALCREVRLGVREADDAR